MKPISNLLHIVVLGCSSAVLSIAAHARLPQISMPAATVDGAPVGLSLVGARGSDAKLLALAEALKGIQD
jgi:amidase